MKVLKINRHSASSHKQNASLHILEYEAEIESFVVEVDGATLLRNTFWHALFGV